MISNENWILFSLAKWVWLSLNRKLWVNWHGDGFVLVTGCTKRLLYVVSKYLFSLLIFLVTPKISNVRFPFKLHHNPKVLCRRFVPFLFSRVSIIEGAHSIVATAQCTEGERRRRQPWNLEWHRITRDLTSSGVVTSRTTAKCHLAKPGCTTCCRRLP